MLGYQRVDEIPSVLVECIKHSVGIACSHNVGPVMLSAPQVCGRKESTHQDSPKFTPPRQSGLTLTEAVGDRSR